VISFITLSRDPEKVNKLNNSLAHALSGTKFELIHMNGTELDLFEGYNEGAARAHYDLLGFLHDDVKLLANWECFAKPVDLMKKPMTGFVGVAGTRVMGTDGTWWKQPPSVLRGLVAHPAQDDNPFGLQFNTWPHTCALFGRVAVVDGVFFMCHKRVLDRIGGFDEKSYKGFHFYDLDTSLRASLAGLLNYVAPIPLLHQSRGVPNENWEQNRQIFVQKFERQLPYEVKS
jgi:GT2 family glycosyltransferase